MASLAKPAARRRLVLHFDLNRTVLMSDSAGGRGMEDTLNYLLSEVCRGTVHPATKEHRGRWVAADLPPSSASPPAEVAGGRALSTYKAFVDTAFPYVKTGEQPLPPEAKGADAATFNKAMKKKRKAAQSSFTSSGQPGERHAPALQHLLKNMHFPAGDARSRAQAMSKELEPGILAETWGCGRYFLLPSFLNFLVYLQSNDALMRAVRISYRTFGKDLEEVAKELDVFAAGKHPLFPGQALDPRLSVRRPFNSFYRRGARSEDVLMACGTLETPPTADFPDAAVDEFYAQVGGSVSLKRGFQAVFEEIAAQISAEPTRAVGIRDYWKWWHANGESDESGKPLLLNGGDGAVHVFIDDHVEHDHAHIVDVRDVKTGEPVPHAQTFGRSLFRAEPYDAILDVRYFVALFERISAAHGLAVPEGAGEQKL